MNSKIKMSALAVVLLVLAGWSLQTAFAQGHSSSPVEEKAHKSRGQGQDSNIKHKSDVNDPKGAPKMRGDTCLVVIENTTPWKIQIYIDGEYAELLGAWSEMSVSVSRTATIYARADFADGTYLYWGPRTPACEAHGYRWKLTD